MPHSVKLRLSPAIFSLLSLLCFTHHLPADENPARISVVPFEYSLGVLKDDAETLQNLFESALIKTKQFTVVKQSDIATILEAQEATDGENRAGQARELGCRLAWLGRLIGVQGGRSEALLSRHPRGQT